MTLPRASLVSCDTTPYYHCISRCVRRALLCGEDALTGRSFEHRRTWIVERLARLEAVFAIDVCAYAIMANHHHLVLKLNPETASAWTDDEVLERWCALFSGPSLVQRYRAGKTLDAAAQAEVDAWAACYRARLADLSWFMRCLNEPIARWANAEDECTGRFWEGRFKSQALLDEPALLTCMAYVDLNPIRARLAPTPEASEFTSIQQRLATALSRDQTAPGRAADPLDHAIPTLLRFGGDTADDGGLPFTRNDYLALVDWSGRAIRPDKPGAIPHDTPPILARLAIAPKPFVRYLNRQERGFHHFLGRPASLEAVVSQLGRRFLKGVSAAHRLFAPQPT